MVLAISANALSRLNVGGSRLLEQNGSGAVLPSCHAVSVKDPSDGVIYQG